MISPISDYDVIRPADISADRFVSLLLAGNSPAASEGEAMHAAIAVRGVSPLFALGMFMVESRFGTVGIAATHATKSIGNVRTPANKANGGEWFDVPGRGRFTRYPTWTAGAADWADRLRGPLYEGAGLTTVRAILPRWAPSSDNNQPEAYARAVLGFIARHREEPPMPTPTIEDDLVSVNHWTGRDGHSIRAVVLHIAEGTEVGTRSWFHNPESQVSAHYFVCNDGRIVRFVRDRDTAWANGRLNKPNTSRPVVARWAQHGINPNKESISVEHEGFTGHGLTDAQWTASASLVAALCASYGVTTDANGILGHRDIDSVNRPRCPGFTDAQWVKFFALVNAGQPAPDPDDAKLEAAYQADIADLGGKWFSAQLTRHYPGLGLVDGKALVTDGGVLVIHEGEVLNLNRRIIDDTLRQWVKDQEAAGTLRRLG